MNRRRTLIFALSLLALPLAAQAQTGTYLSVGAGFNKMQEEDVDARLTASPTTDIPGEVVTSVGPAFVFAVGRGLTKNFRMEAEGSFRSNGIKGETGLSGEDFGTGTERKSGLMANGLFDLGGSKVKPYFGGGIGAQFVHEPDASSTTGGVPCTQPGCVVVAVAGGTKSSFAYQLIAGAAFSVHSKGLSFTAEYRFLSLVGKRTYSGTATVPGAGVFELTDTSSNDMNHSVIFGIRYAFGG
jgi:OOP family OmpA-OmpF porin